MEVYDSYGNKLERYDSVELQIRRNQDGSSAKYYGNFKEIKFNGTTIQLDLEFHGKFNVDYPYGPTIKVIKNPE